MLKELVKYFYKSEGLFLIGNLDVDHKLNTYIFEITNYNFSIY